MHPFLMFSLYQKYLNHQKMVNSVVYHPSLSFKISLKANKNIYLTFDLNK